MNFMFLLCITLKVTTSKINSIGKYAILNDIKCECDIYEIFSFSYTKTLRNLMYLMQQSFVIYVSK